MLLTENESKSILAEAAIAVPSGMMVRSADTVPAINAFPVAVKAQVASGGRGLAGGVVKANSQDEVVAAVARILRMEFDGARPEAVLVEPWLALDRELYLSVAVDGSAGGYVVLYSPEGGVRVEQGAPLVRYAVGHPENFRAHKMRLLMRDAETDATTRERVISMAQALLRLAHSRDLVTVEINPLAKLSDNKLVALDAKVVVDESAQFRSALIASAVDRAIQAESPMIRDALEQRLMLVWLKGAIGLISGGAGMTMAAMDMLHAAGGSAACFLDCSANPTPAGYEMAFRLLDAQPQVTAILVAIFGGGTHMDRVARVMVGLMAKRQSAKPVVFRLNGTNGQAVAPIFAAAGLTNHLLLEDAVTEVVAVACKEMSWPS